MARLADTTCILALARALFIASIYFLAKLSLLPARRDDTDVLITEEDMIRERHKRDIEYLVTRGQDLAFESPKEYEEAANKVKAVEAAMNDISKCSLHLLLLTMISIVFNQLEQKANESEQWRLKSGTRNIALKNTLLEDHSIHDSIA